MKDCIETKMNWLKTLCDQVLEEKSDAKAAKALYADGAGGVPSPLKERAKFLREAWRDRPSSEAELAEAMVSLAATKVAGELGRDVGAMRDALEAAVQGRLSADFEDKKRQHALLYLGLRHLEGVTHINPWSEATTRAGRVLSNMTTAPFELRGVTFASAESYLQSMRLRPGITMPSREQVGAMDAERAREFGRAAKKDTQRRLGMDDGVWLWGREGEGPRERRTAAFEEAMTEALTAKARAHAKVAEALAVCAELPVVHYLRRRGRYKLERSSHLPVCLPKVWATLKEEVGEVTDEAKAFWLTPACVDVQL